LYKIYLCKKKRKKGETGFYISSLVMKKLLIASGCSFTEKDFVSTYHPEMDCTWDKWPELLAEKLNMNCINLGSRGAGNEYIYNSIVEQVIKTKNNKIGLIVVGWSESKRFNFVPNTLLRHRLPTDINHPSPILISDFPQRDYSLSKLHPKIKNPYKRRPFGQDYEQDMLTLEYVVNRSIGFFFNLQTLCENYNIPLKHFSMIDLFSRGADMVDLFNRLKNNSIDLEKLFMKIMLNNPYLNIINNDFIGWPIKTELGGFDVWNIVNENAGYQTSTESDLYQRLYWPTMISEKDSHPNIEGQKLIAEFLYENISS
tara:strand:+ start:197 stop:1138 length:942 start_codon:yes stop_codon:yes gene_type:complete